MIGAILLFGVLAGLDNLQVCSSIALLPIERRRMHALAATFSLCEMAAPLLGLVVGRTALNLLDPRAALAGPLMTLVCGATVLICALRKEDVGTFAGSRVMLGLPLSLSLDNLIAGVGVSAIHYPVWPAALMIGAVSALMSCAGLYAAGFVRTRLLKLFPVPLEGMVGVYLCFLAVKILLADVA
jgi:putative Mn2+ efflux pump MntP